MLKSVVRLQATEVGFDPERAAHRPGRAPGPAVQRPARHAVPRRPGRTAGRPRRHRRGRLRQLRSRIRRVQRDDGHVSGPPASPARQRAGGRRSLGIAALLRHARHPVGPRAGFHRPRSRRAAEGRRDQRGGGAGVLGKRRSHRPAHRGRTGRVPGRRGGRGRRRRRPLRRGRDLRAPGRLPAAPAVEASLRLHLRPEPDRGRAAGRGRAARRAGAGSRSPAHRHQDDGAAVQRGDVAHPNERGAAGRVRGAGAAARRAGALRAHVAGGGAAPARARRAAWRSARRAATSCA